MLEYLRGFNFLSALVRLALALAVGGVIGYGRSRKQRSAGFRTYMLVSVGAALTILISLYEYDMLLGPWADVVEEAGLKFDGTRYGAQVITGVGFLAAGTIIGVEHQQVSGLTTAIGLVVTACLGIATGAGFYEAVIPAALLVIFSMEVLQPVEIGFKRRMKNITVYVEYDRPDDLETVTGVVTGRGARLYTVDVEEIGEDHPSAILSMKMGDRHPSHSGMLSALAELPCVRSVRELIS